MNLSDILPLIKVDKEFALWRLLSKKIKGCDGFGGSSNLSEFLALNPDYKFFFFFHYYGKTME